MSEKWHKINDFFKVGKWYRVKNQLAFQKELLFSEETISFSVGSRFLFLKVIKQTQQTYHAGLHDEFNYFLMSILHENKLICVIFGEDCYFAQNLKLYLEKIS